LRIGNHTVTGGIPPMRRDLRVACPLAGRPHDGSLMLNGMTQDEFYLRRYIAPILPVAMLSAGCSILLIWAFNRIIGPFLGVRTELVIVGGAVALIGLAWLCRRLALAGRLHLASLTIVLYGGIFAVILAVRATARHDGLTSVMLPLMIIVLIGAMFAHRAWHLLLGYVVTMTPAWLFSHEFAPAITPEARNFPQAALFALATAITFYALSARFRRYFYGILREQDERAQRDPLTQLLNRSVWLERAGAALERAAANGGQIAILFADVDRFKQINDRFGHARGDEVLVRVADLLGGHLPAEALIARFGGEEFVALLTDCDERRARLRALRVQAAMQREALPGLAPTISIGIAIHNAGEPLSHTLHRADMALLRAKNLGRNRVEVAVPLPEPGVQRDEAIPEPGTTLSIAPVPGP